MADDVALAKAEILERHLDDFLAFARVQIAASGASDLP